MKDLKMTKIVYNACFGGFSLSHEAIMRYAEIKGITLYVQEDLFMNHYYLCPPEEFERIQAEDYAKPVQPGRFDASSALYFSDRDIERNDPALVQVVEELGNLANANSSRLEIEELPAGTLYRIDEYDGLESVETKDSYEWKIA
jgi:hypothetical protein